METNKKIIVKLGAVLVGVLLFLTFFSNTIYSLNLAGVTADFPKDGVILRTARAEGSADFTDSTYVCANNAGKITLLAGAGELVRTGSGLFTIFSDISDLNDRLLSETNRMEKARIDLQKTATDLAYQQNKLDTLSPGPAQTTDVKPPSLHTYDYEMERISAEIVNTEAEYQSARSLFEQGAESREKLTACETKLAALRLEYKYNEEQKAKASADYAAAVLKAEADDRQAIEKQMDAYEAEKNTLLNAIKALQYQEDALLLDESSAAHAVERLTQQIAADGVETVYAEQDGVVCEIPAGVENGAFIDRNRPVMRLGIVNTGHPYKTSVEFSDTVDYLEVGQELKLTIRSGRLYGIPGVLEGLRFVNGRLRADIVFNADGLIGGEKVEALAQKVSELYGVVLPNSAIRKDEEGDYVLYVERVKNTLLGYSYYARRMQIYIHEQDDKNTAFSFFSNVTEPIIINSDRPVAKGDRVRLVSGDELIGTR